jgi:hypothetical protein
MKAGIPGARPTNDPFARALVPAATNCHAVLVRRV